VLAFLVVCVTVFFDCSSCMEMCISFSRTNL
jgi:hypothetical protein